MARRSIQGARILITGASQGIGRALAEEAARAGARVLAAARSEDLLAQLAGEVRRQGGILEVVKADVTLAEDRQQMVEAVLKHFGGLDVLINNAGIGATGHFAQASPERLRRIMEVNFFGLAETTRIFIPILKAGKDPAIVNISSIVGKRGVPARSEYSASKFAVQGLSEALRAELAKDGIDVIVVSPGLTQTHFPDHMLERKARMPLEHLRAMTAQQVAQATLHALEKGKREVCLTFRGKLIVFVSRFFPALADRIAAKRVKALYADEMAARENPQVPPGGQSIFGGREDKRVKNGPR